jgi:hypothetical protein
MGETSARFVIVEARLDELIQAKEDLARVDVGDVVD